LQRTYGDRMAKTIKVRMGVLVDAPNLAAVPHEKPVRCHQLRENRDEEFAVDLIHPRRLVFRPDHNPIPQLPGTGGIDKAAVTDIEITEIIDYH
jgi:proteic killer suppression protein